MLPPSSKRGSIAWIILIFFIILILLLLGFDDLYLANFACEDAESRAGCIFGELLGDEDETAENSVVAKGTISRTIKGSERSVDVELTIPLKGGAVTGTISGDCEGSAKGTYANGRISGTAKGICAYFLPFSGTFNGSVNTGTKKVPLTAQGTALGKTGGGSATLSY